MSYRAISQEDQTPTTTTKKDINAPSIFIFLSSPVKIHDQPTYQTWYGCNLEVLCVNSLVCMRSLTRLKLRLFQCPVFGFLPSSGPFKKCLS